MRAFVLTLGLTLGCAPVPDDRPEPAPHGSVEPEPEPSLPDGLLAWHWTVHADDEAFPQVRDVHTEDNLSYQFVVGDDDRARVIKTGSKGRLEWTFELPEMSLPGGYLLLHGDNLFVAFHSHIATGAHVFDLDTETGTQIWTADVLGLGPIGHSKYRNRVQLAVRGHALIVYGHEAQGRYVEALHTDTGQLLANRKVDDAEAEVAR